MTSAPAAGKAQDLTELWGRMVEAAGRVSPFARTYLLEAHPVPFARNVFTIGFDPEFADHLGLVDNSRNRTLLGTKLQELGFPNAQVKFVQADAPAGWMPKMEAPSAVSASGATCFDRCSTGREQAGSTGAPSGEPGRFQERSTDSQGPGDF